MNINIQQTPNLPHDLDFKITHAGFESGVIEYLDDLVSALENYMRKLYTDISKGTTTFRSVSTQPTQSDLNDGQVVCWNECLVVKLGGVLYKVKLLPLGASNLVCGLTVTSS